MGHWWSTEVQKYVGEILQGRQRHHVSTTFCCLAHSCKTKVTLLVGYTKLKKCKNAKK